MSLKIYGANKPSGGEEGALDAIDGAILSDNDFALVAYGTAFYIYKLDATSGETESGDAIIAPDSNAGTKRWILLNLYSGQSTSWEFQTATDGQTVFTLSSISYATGVKNLIVVHNGKILALDNGDYTETSVTSVTLANPAVEGDTMLFMTTDNIAVGNFMTAAANAQSAQTGAETAETNAEAAQAAAELARDQSQAAASSNQASVSADDTTPAYLEDKIVAGTNVTVTVTSPGGNEKVSIAAELTDLDLTTPGSDHTAYGITRTETAGESLVFGEVCYLKSDGKAWKADADASTSMPVVLMALASISADASGSFLVVGIARDDSWSWTAGDTIYASTTAGGLTSTAPSGSGDQVQVVGVARSSTQIFFLPDKTLVEIS